MPQQHERGAANITLRAFCSRWVSHWRANVTRLVEKKTKQQATYSTSSRQTGGTLKKRGAGTQPPKTTKDMSSPFAVQPRHLVTIGEKEESER